MDNTDGDSSSIIQQFMYPIIEKNGNNLCDEDEWIKWRKEHKQDYFFASTVSCFCGCGYVSPKSSIEDIINNEHRPINDYVKKAVAHGSYNEKSAIKMVMNLLSQWYNVHEWNNDLATRVFDIEEADIKLAATPDLILTRNHLPVICEIKCPFFWKYKHGSIGEAILDTKRIHPYGRLNAFIQAHLYCMCYGGNEFMVVMYFTNDIEEAVLLFQYKKMERVSKLLIERMKQVKEMVKEGKYKRLKNLKNELNECIKKSHIKTLKTKTKIKLYNE